MPLVTIDGEDARDFDDAVYCEPARVGKTRVA
jgi:ribonuclease R